MVFIDEYSRYPIAEVVQKLTANSVIPVADKTFAMLGYPEVERMNQPILKAIRSAVVQHRSWQQELHKLTSMRIA
jgi:hypothetical protein